MSAPKTTSGRARPHRLAEGDGVVAQVAALHPLQDQVVAGLQRQVQVRHQPRLAGDRLDQPRVGLDLVDRREPQPRQVRHAGEDRGDEVAEPRRALEVGAPARQVDAGQHHLVEAAVDQPRDLRDHGRRRHAARVAAAVGDDAEGAAVVAAGLHLHIGARPGAEPVDQRRRRPALGHDVADRDPRRRAPASRAQASGRSFSALPSTRSTSGIAAKVAGSVCAAQPVTTTPRVRVVAAQAADLLARLPHRLGGDGAAVDHHRVARRRRRRRGPSSPRSRRRSAGSRGWRRPARVTPAPARKSADSRPSKTSVVGPVIQTPSSRQSIPSSPPSSRTVTRRPVSPRRAVTTAAAQAPEPQASVTMPPRSQTRIRMVVAVDHLHELDVGALREQRIVLDARRRSPRRRPPRRPAR